MGAAAFAVADEAPWDSGWRDLAGPGVLSRSIGLLLGVALLPFLGWALWSEAAPDGSPRGGRLRPGTLYWIGVGGWFAGYLIDYVHNALFLLGDVPRWRRPGRVRGSVSGG